MAIENPFFVVAYESSLGWVDLDLNIDDPSPDPVLAMQPVSEGYPIAGVRIFRSAQETLRLPREILGSVVSLVGTKTDQSKAYIALGVDLNNDVEITITAVDETGGENGGGGEGQAHIAGTVQIDGTPAARDVVVIKDDPTGRKVVAVGQSSGDGTFDISYTGWGGPVIALALDHYGNDFQTSAALNAGAIVHPSIPNGFVYEVTVAGTTGTEEPAWSTGASVQSGSVTFDPRPYYRPVASGPLQGEELEP
ncbi:MAG: hypothetical protein VX256_14435 [Pseudomonadota bacterium]|nr:hypothetical protein [Pseudomonadota bacterium]